MNAFIILHPQQLCSLPSFPKLLSYLYSFVYLNLTSFILWNYKTKYEKKNVQKHKCKETVTMNYLNCGCEKKILYLQFLVCMEVVPLEVQFCPKISSGKRHDLWCLFLHLVHILTFYLASLSTTDGKTKLYSFKDKKNRWQSHDQKEK